MPDGGKAKVEVDGRHISNLDFYGPGSREIVSHTFNGYGPGAHEIKLTVTGESVPASKGQGVYVFGMENLE